jgi:superfamily II DNA or RNA helicase
MTRGLDALPIRTEYRTGEQDLVGDFYEPCLERSVRYDRAVGYFKSTVFVAVGSALIDFARRGGIYRVVCSPQLSEDDIEAIGKGYEDRQALIERALQADIEGLLAHADTRERTVAIATLIAVGRMDIRIAFRPPQLGLFHEKLGVFVDDTGNAISFKGSSNETWNAWHDLGNHESFEVFRSWIPTEGERILRHREYFERLWAGKVQNVSTMAVPDGALRLLGQVAKERLEDVSIPRSRAGRRPLLPHQLLAVANWEAAGRRGVLEHATGSGKTITALAAIERHLKLALPAIVLVPSDLLLRQWLEEIEREIDDVSVLVVGGGKTNWKKPGRVEAFTSPGTDLGRRLVLATLQSASKPEFFRRVRGGAHLLVVCDEVHRAGSVQNSKVLEVDAGARLGLSATPRRFGDDQGTTLIFGYFGDVVPPTFTLADAINAGRLVPYEYYPHIVHLTESEEDAWKAISREISRESAIARGGSKQPVPMTERVRLLLIRRAGIIKRASAKRSLAVDVLRQNFEKGQHWLAYCDDIQQASEVRTALEAADLPASEYHTGMSGSPVETLRWFALYGGILVSIRCLDEGVDIPQASHALILASSQNPREFIQRRGRILRTDPNDELKRLAIIHDAIVLPKAISEEEDYSAIVKAEVARAIEFSKMAKNPGGEADLLRIAVELGLDLEHLLNAGVEDDDFIPNNGEA